MYNLVTVWSSVFRYTSTREYRHSLPGMYDTTYQVYESMLDTIVVPHARYDSALLLDSSVSYKLGCSSTVTTALLVQGVHYGEP